MTAFHEVSFPLPLAMGARGGPRRRVDIQSTASGREVRSTPWARSRRRWDAGVGVRTLDDLHTLVTFFEARRGPLHGFRWRDPVDWTSGPPSAAITPFDQAIGAGDGATTVFQLVKRYADAADGVDRVIAKPVGSTVVAAVDGAPTPLAATDAATGLITFATPPPEGAAVAAGFAFDTPVRFDVDRLELDLEAFRAGSVPHVPVVEILV